MQSLGLGFGASAFAGSQAVLNGKSAVAPAAGRGSLQVRTRWIGAARRPAAPARARIGRRL
jgi:hypothetical protein